MCRDLSPKTARYLLFLCRMRAQYPVAITLIISIGALLTACQKKQVEQTLFRLTVEPTPQTGLRSVSQIMIDKITTVKRDKIGKSIGCVEDETVRRMNRAITLWFGLGA